MHRRTLLAAALALPAIRPATAQGLFTIKVSWRGRDRWAVMHHGWCFDADGNKDYESIPSERRDDWLERHRFDLDTALALAKRIAPTMTVGPHTVASILAETDEEPTS